MRATNYQRIILGLSLLAAAPAARAQRAIWASKVVGVSSQKAKGKEAFSPEKVLGNPNALPLGQISDDAWIPKKEGANEFIEVRFGRSMFAQQVTVVENFNPGAITKIEVVDTQGERHEVYRNERPGPLPETFRSLQARFPAAKYRTIGVVVHLNTAKVEGINQIDAIGIADVAAEMVRQDFKAPVPTAEELKTVDSTLVTLGPNVNTRAVDTHPVISPDGRSLFFARQGHPLNIGGNADPQDVWVSTLRSAQTKSWGPARNLGGPVNNGNEPSGLASVSADGRSALLIGAYEPSGAIEPQGFSFTRRTPVGWSKPEKISIEDFYNKDKEHIDAFLATSGKALLMAVERNDGLGGQDLYVSFPSQDGKTWSKPRNLGPEINTKKADFAPFLAADEKTLYFASEGLGGYGKSDIFYSKRLDDTWTNWSPPRNLGSAVNSPDFDAYYTVSAAGDDAYLVSDRNGMDGSKDIFRIALSPKFKPEVVTLVTGRVLDAATGKPVKARIIYENLLTGEEIGVAETNPTDGTYTIVLPSGVQYGYRAEAKDYLAENASLDATDRDRYNEQKQDLFLVPFAVGQTVKLNNIFFQQSKYYLSPSSYPELARLVRILKDYPGVEIKIAGHTDNQGDPALNLKLSVDRVNEVKRYLISRGIAADRVSTEGFGGTKPLGSNEQEETRRLNRRVEFTITKK